MENKKLLKFLYKDIAEIEDLFMEKGSEGFDEYEIEFIQSRFKGAKKIIQIFSEKENKRLVREPVQVRAQPKVEEKPAEQATLSAEVEESLESLSEFEKELKDDQNSKAKEIVESPAPPVVEESVVAEKSPDPVTEQKVEPVKQEKDVQEVVEEQSSETSSVTNSAPVNEKQETVSTQPDSAVELEDEVNDDDANNRLGDSFSKEKSVNELLAGDSNKLEHKISNSPVSSIKSSIGINDRYQFIRELFDGDAEHFSKAVNELDNLNSINEAVSYLQQNYKWKKNEISLKFVSLVKRRFPNE